MESEEQQQSVQTEDGAAASSAPEAQASGGESAGGGATQAGDAVPAAASENQAGASEVAANAEKKDGEKTEEKKEDVDKEAKEGAGVAKEAYKAGKELNEAREAEKKIEEAAKVGKGAEEASKFAGKVSTLDKLGGIKDGIVEGKEAYDAIKKGEYGTAAAKGIQAATDLATPILDKTPIGKAVHVGAKAGAEIGDYGLKNSEKSSAVQGTLRTLGLEGDGEKKSITQVQQELGDRVEAKTGSHALNVATRVATSIPAAPLAVVSAGENAARSGWNWAKDKWSKLRGAQDG